jgi:cell fate (sporulation/competence/biofilm development) regulator YlbF (YheA/YmcA/DUF963 family)
MDEILKKANELGLMIRGTEIFRRFDELSKKLEADEESRSLLEKYAALSDEIHDKELSGEAINPEDKKALEDMSGKLSKSVLVKEYIATQSYYVNMLMQIQKIISEPAGDPITESKIITPGSTGKIITDF